ncbi:MAG: acetolactate synthase small subunit, partial [Actinomycetota bacterium]
MQELGPGARQEAGRPGRPRLVLPDDLGGVDDLVGVLVLVVGRVRIVVVGDDRVLEQIRKQLEKIVTVVKVVDISSQDYVERDLMLLKVKAPPGGKRSEIRELTDIFRGRIVDVGPEEIMIEISGRENKVEAFIDRMRPYGIIELVRTGRIAMVRSASRPPETNTGPIRSFLLHILAKRTVLKLRSR